MQGITAVGHMGQLTTVIGIVVGGTGTSAGAACALDLRYGKVGAALSQIRLNLLLTFWGRAPFPTLCLLCRFVAITDLQFFLIWVLTFNS